MEPGLWMKIGSALLIGAMLVFLLPRAKHMMQNSPKAGEGDWKAVLIPLLLLVLFILFLITIVKT
jgi:hypothetical protein